MKAIFKGEIVVRTKLTLDTGLERLGGSDVSYFVRRPKLTHEATEEKGGTILEKDLSFNKILLLKDANEVTVDELTFVLSGTIDYNLDEECVVFYTDVCCSIEDADKQEKIEAYHKLLDAYEKQVGTKEDQEEECDCAYCNGDYVCAFCRDDDEPESDDEENIKKKAMNDLDEILTGFFGDVPGFKC